MEYKNLFHCLNGSLVYKNYTIAVIREITQSWERWLGNVYLWYSNLKIIQMNINKIANNAENVLSAKALIFLKSDEAKLMFIGPCIILIVE